MDNRAHLQHSSETVHNAPAMSEACAPPGRRNPLQTKLCPAISVSYLQITSFVMQMQLPLGAGSEARFIVKQIKALIAESRISQHARLKKYLCISKQKVILIGKQKGTNSPLALDLYL